MSVRLMVYGIWCSATAVVSSNKILVSTDINIVMFVCVCVRLILIIIVVMYHFRDFV